MRLIEQFYSDEEQYQDIWSGWIGDALTDHESNIEEHMKIKMQLVRMYKDHIRASQERLDVERMHEWQVKLEREYRDLGKWVFDLVDNYMEDASRRCE